MPCILCISILSCNTEVGESWQGSVEGKAQKGPFINGASISAFELNDELNQTGNIYYSQISNNAGSFNLNGVSLISGNIQLRIDGFYFNEVCGELSATQITLNGIVDATQSSSFNLNVLTHLEKDRIKELVNSGISFGLAKTQTQSDLLEVFGITNVTGLSNSELLDMSGSSNGDAVMIALSCIMQGHRNETALSAVLANFITDFAPDGELNDTALISDLVLHAQSLVLSEVRSNIENRYAQLGISVTVPDFETYVNSFLSANTVISNRSVIDYPEVGANGVNVLDLTRVNYPAGGPHSLAANMPNECMSVRIKISKIGGPPCGGCWLIQSSSMQNWIKESYNSSDHTQIFNSNGTNCDVSMTFSAGTVLFEYYEQGSATPTHSKTVEFQ